MECSDNINPAFVPSVSRICNENIIGSKIKVKSAVGKEITNWIKSMLF